MPRYRQRKGLSIYCGDAVAELSEFPDRSVHMCITSPPYWGLRKYKCDDTQIGSEYSIESYVTNLVSVFEEVHRVLRDDGTLWLNLGDGYIDKNLSGIPWRVAFALKDCGWMLRQDIVYAKKNAMPAPCTDRCVSSHEYVFLFSKGPRYFFDYMAIREPCVDEKYRTTGYKKGKCQRSFYQEDPVRGRTYAGLNKSTPPTQMRNKRDVWFLATQSSKLRHFAAFPEKLVEPCIMAGTSDAGCCTTCGDQLERVVNKSRRSTRPAKKSKTYGSEPEEYGNRDPLRHVTEMETAGWRKTCDCHESSFGPCIVLDPFFGTGTTGLVANNLGRACVGIDLSRDYCDLAWDRLRQIPFQQWEFVNGLSDSVDTGEERQVVGDS
jgi:site-specific DNA-methyltransferase (adenine-specific)